ncbi:transposase, partial [Chromohalobacter japonicus]
DQLELKSWVRPKRYRAYRGEVGRRAPNRLQRDFRADRPHQKWATDVTEFNIRGEKVYLSPVLDLYNQEVVAYEVSRTPRLLMVVTMLDKALRRVEDAQGLVLHSDQGWQYQMADYRHRVTARGAEISMSRKGNCLDNAVMENFFGVLKSEFFHGQRFSDVTTFIEELESYLHYYNHERIKVKLKGLSPVEYRTQALNTD